MSHWNNRIFKEYQKYGNNAKGNPILMDGKDGEWSYSVRETYYNDEGEVTMFSDAPRPAFGEDLKGIKWSLTKMLEACDKEVLDVNMKLAKTDFDNEIPVDSDEVSEDKEYHDVKWGKYREITQKYEYRVQFEFRKDSIVAVYDTSAYMENLRTSVTKDLREIGVHYLVEIAHEVDTIELQ
jgi:hypothetical protein